MGTGVHRVRICVCYKFDASASKHNVAWIVMYLHLD